MPATDPALSPRSLAAHRLARAPPSRPAFDPWNNSSRGHQIGDTNPAADRGWRESRRRKLNAQFSGGLGNDGGERIYDLVGKGAKDDGLEYHARLRGVTRSRDGDIWGDVGDWIAQDSEKTPDTNEEAKNWDVLTRQSKTRVMARTLRTRNTTEEEICKLGRGRKRSWEQALGEKEEPIANAESLQVAELVALAEDSDEIWDPVIREELESETEPTVTIQTHQVETMPENTTEVVKNSTSINLHLDLDDDELWDPGFDDEALSAVSLPVEENHSEAGDSPRRQETPPPSSQRRPEPEPSPSPPPTPPPPATAILSQPYRPPRHLSPPSLLEQAPKPIFRALTVFVSGSTMPHISDHALRTLLVSHGANVSISIAKRQVTHVIVGAVGAHEDSLDPRNDYLNEPKRERTGGVMSALSRQREAKRVRTNGGNGIRYVHVRWVLESIEMGRRLPEARFAVGVDEDDKDQQEDQGRQFKKLKKAVRRPVPSTTQAMRSGPLTAAERATIGIPESSTFDMGLRSGGRGGSRGRGRGRGRGEDRRAIKAPGVPAGQRSVRTMFIHQAREQIWQKAGFEKK